MFGDRAGKTIRDATEEWVSGMNQIPYAVVEKLMKADFDSIHEITPPAAGDPVFICGGDYNCEYGEIIRQSDDDDDVYIVRREGKKRGVRIDKGNLEVQRGGHLPMWGTLWSFGDSADDYWLEECGGLQKMADCGFRIYENEDYGYIFGIDGAGYSFFEAHWVPLYKARGLRWHDPATEDSMNDVINKLKAVFQSGEKPLIEKLVGLGRYEAVNIGGSFGGHLPIGVEEKLEQTGHFRCKYIRQVAEGDEGQQESGYWRIERIV